MVNGEFTKMIGTTHDTGEHDRINTFNHRASKALTAWDSIYPAPPVTNIDRLNSL